MELLKLGASEKNRVNLYRTTPLKLRAQKAFVGVHIFGSFASVFVVRLPPADKAARLRAVFLRHCENLPNMASFGKIGFSSLDT